MQWMFHQLLLPPPVQVTPPQGIGPQKCHIITVFGSGPAGTFPLVKCLYIKQMVLHNTSTASGSDKAYPFSGTTKLIYVGLLSTLL